MVARPIPAFYACYLLRSTVRHQSLYVGSTPHPARRLKQHNGEARGGAVRTSRDSLRPWEMVCLVTGFPSKIAALQFEWAWQNTHLTRHISPNSRLTKTMTSVRISPKTGRSRKRPVRPRLSLTDRVANLFLLLRASSFERWPLKVTFYAQDVYRVWKKWTEQHIEHLRPGIEVSLDQSRATDPAKDVPPATVAQGIMTVDVGYSALQHHLEKSQQLLDDAQWLKCAVCNNGLPASGAMTLVCPNDGCDAMSHIHCLSTRFLSSESQEDLVPTSGTCPTCNAQLQWIDLVKELSLRMRGANEIAKLYKKRREGKGRSNIAASGAAGVLVADEDELDDPEMSADDFYELPESSHMETDEISEHGKRPSTSSKENLAESRSIIEDSEWDEAEVVS